MTVGFTTFFPKRVDTKFVVKNIAPNNKRIRIFNYPINNGDVRDLMAIPQVSEADLRHALLKGELMIKFLNREVTVVASNIDLIQFDDEQRAFLTSIGVNLGLDAGSGAARIEDVSLLGTKNGINTIFTLPSGTFLYSTDFKIAVYRNGVRQKFTSNYLISESGGPGTGYDTIIFIEPPESDEELIIDYYPG